MFAGDDRVVITGMGVMSAIGVDVRSFWESLINGTSGAGRIEEFSTEGFASDVGAKVRGPVEVGDRTVGRATALGVAAARQALGQAGITDELLDDVALTVGTTMGEGCWIESWTAEEAKGPLDPDRAAQMRRSGPDQIAADMARMLGIGGRQTVYAAACAAGNYAIGRAADLVRSGACEIVLAGGADAFSRTALAGFGRLGALTQSACRPFSADRDGLLLGEGAAFVVVESARTAVGRGRQPLCSVDGFGLSCDAHNIVSPSPGGEGMARAMRAAVVDAGMSERDIDYVCAHGTGTPMNDSTEVAALRAVFGEVDGELRPPASSIKALTGHSLGAASALEAVACVMTLREQIAPPTWNHRTPDPDCDWDIVPNEPRPGSYRAVLNNAAAFGGNNAALVISTWGLP